MGKRGPRPTPTAVLKMRGSWRTALREGEVQPTRALPECPEWLDDGAKDAWRQIVPQLDSMGVLTLIDSNALARYCTLWAYWIGAQKFLKQYGTTYPIKNSDGSLRYMQTFPQVSQMRGWGEQLRRLEAEFGMTPASRVGLDTSAVGVPNNPLESFLAEKDA